LLTNLSFQQVGKEIMQNSEAWKLEGNSADAFMIKKLKWSSYFIV